MKPGCVTATPPESRFRILKAYRRTPALRARRSEGASPTLLAAQPLIVDPHDIRSVMHEPAVRTRPRWPQSRAVTTLCITAPPRDYPRSVTRVIAVFPVERPSQGSRILRFSIIQPFRPKLLRAVAAASHRACKVSGLSRSPLARFQETSPRVCQIRKLANTEVAVEVNLFR